MRLTDEILLELALKGDGQSFGELVGRWERRIYGFVRRYVGNREDARDLTQTTFFKAYQNLDRLTDPGHFSSWLHTIALNECRMAFRRLKRVRPVPLEESQDEVDRQEPLSASPERTAAGRERVRILESAFGRLPAEQREVILMKEFQGLKFHEIAEILGVPVSTAKSRLYLGLKTLKRLMENGNDL